MMRPNTVSCGFASLAVAAMALRKVAPTPAAESETPDYLSANICRLEKQGGLGAWAANALTRWSSITSPWN
jgi:hypothetical protein